MKARTSLGAIALALLLAGCGGGDGNTLANAASGQSAALPQIPAPNNGDWREVVTQTPEGGFRMGNPDAPVKLVEYASLACPHCKDFTAASLTALRDSYVRSGQVSWEFRNFLLNAPDVSLTVLARCQPPAAFFRTVEQMYQQQSEFFNAIDDNEGRTIGALPPENQVIPLARAMDLDTFFARRGMPEARFVSCLSDRAGIQRVTDMTNHAVNSEQVTGTPSFFINGTKQEAGDWPALEPQLRSAMGL
ncbi:MAG TPA: thioredoxin domain-containing protein [Allosphingosinicella sp.]|jgi:protein-disulfide isomerase